MLLGVEKGRIRALWVNCISRELTVIFVILLLRVRIGTSLNKLTLSKAVKHILKNIVLRSTNERTNK